MGKHTATVRVAILKMVRDGASVLDVGCGDGTLLGLLAREKRVRGQGIETDESLIRECVAKGVGVFHDEYDKGLAEYPDGAFDYVVLDGSFQKVKSPDALIQDALRVGRRVIAGFPNFAHYSVRLQVLFLGRTPITKELPYQWYNTPNMHFLSVSDFIRYCARNGIVVEESKFLTSRSETRLLPGLFARRALFLLRGRK